LIFDRETRVLLVKHTYGKLNWELPGGHSEPDESADQTVVREVREETGLRVEPERLSGVYYSEPGDMHHFAFVCTMVDQYAEPVPSSQEIADCRFFSRDDLPRPISDFTIRRIDDALAQHPTLNISRIGPRVWFDE
jgi:8-oxo-dGTP pyrophosphatase MutT (NUDIX family)